jgi:hypothetical protein
MSTVIFKLRVKDPLKKGQPWKNKAHTEYLGRRRGVELNAGMKHGLFGIVEGKQAESIENIRVISRYVKAKTLAGTVTYRAVISLAEDDALRLGYDDAEKWRELVRGEMPELCDKIGIPIQNLEYTAAIHFEKGHPHCHIQFWDKGQDIKRPFVAPEVPKAVRVRLIKQVFREEMTDIIALKDEARKAALENAGTFFGQFLSGFEVMTDGGYAQAVERLQWQEALNNGKLLYNHFKADDLRRLAVAFSALSGRVPPSGRRSFKFMPAGVKQEIRDFIRLLLDVNADCRREFSRYGSAAASLASFYSDDPLSHEKARHKAEADLEARLGNSLLKMVKQAKGGQAEREVKNQDMAEALTQIFFMLSRSTQAAENRLSYARRRGEVSKQAKKELARKKEASTNMDWDIEF